MKVLVTGAQGQLGYDVVKELAVRNLSYFGVGRTECDITDGDAVRHCFSAYRPDMVIHCAAYTAVDRAEDEEERCRAVNVWGTENVAHACAELGAKMIYLSTDYVFPGDGGTPFETDAPTGPLNVYGRSKLDGEKIVQEALNQYFIVRTSWVFGKHGKNFVKTMLRLGREKPFVNVVCDQIGSPTYTVDLASLLCDMAGSQRYGIYHATNEEFCSWAEFAMEIFRQSVSTTRVVSITSEQYPARAVRPLNSRLSKKSLDKAGFRRLPKWQDALKRFLEESYGQSD